MATSASPLASVGVLVRATSRTRGRIVLGDYPIAPMIPATDMARARAFYADTLGLKVVSEDPETLELESGGVHFGVYPTRAEAGTATVAGWIVADLDAEMRDLRQRGVTFEEYDLGDIQTHDGVADFGDERGAWFKDSEGNVLGVVQTSNR
jgi:catechol 2,3-dioxygenase-like lactoylglutathione lyase family enzyme